MWQEDFDLKFWAAVRLARLAVPRMKAQGRGAIVHITHPGGKAPDAHSVPTSISRAAGIAFTKALSKDMAAHTSASIRSAHQYQNRPERTRLEGVGH